MKFELTASAVLCAALISGCSSAPTLAVPDGEWENFTQQYQPAPQPAYAPLPVAPVELAQGPVTTVYAPNPVVAFTPPPGSTPVKPAAATVVLPVSEKTLPQTTPVSTPAAPALASGSFGVASASPGAVPPVTAGPPVPGTVKTAAAAVAQVEPKPGSAPATVKASPASAKPVTPVPPSPPVPAAPAPKPLKAWTVSPQDKTIRETLAKWAKAEGWTFNPLGRDYWTVPHDFDVVAAETFQGDFKDVVRKLVASTELTSTPLQPCFFSNKAVRVILINEECAAQASQGHKS